MNVWLMHVGEDLPIDESPRKFRYSHLADALVARGHRVTRWAPTFHHSRKIYRRQTDTDVQISPDYQIRLVHAVGYRANASIARLKSYRALAHRFTELADASTPPQLILSGIPSLEWCRAAVNFAHRHDIPAVIDVRDLWPDVYLNSLPRPLRPLGRRMLGGVYRHTRQMLQGAAAITAISESYLDWALKLSSRQRGPSDCVFPIGFAPPHVSKEELSSARAGLLRKGVDPARVICLFIGAFEQSYDLSAIIAAARIAHGAGHRALQFVFCGDGSKMATIQKLSAGLPNVLLLGRLGPAELKAAAEMASIGLATYKREALQSLPNKIFEYLAGGLAIVSSLSGEVAELLAIHRCGVTYPAQDANSLFQQLASLESQQPRLRTMQANALRLWSNDYRSVEVYGRFADYLERVASAAGSLITMPTHRSTPEPRLQSA